MAYTFKKFEQSEESKKADAKAAEYDTTYEDPQSVTDLWKKMTDYETNNNPGEWDGGTYGQARNDAWNAINNREKFSYDLNGDALYQQYKDKFINQGRLAMADTIGQASAMTGGYGSSYAVTAGNQAYQSHLQNLNDIVPQLYQMALDKYNQEGQDLKDKYSIINNMYQTEYGEHRDNVSDYNTTLDRYTNAYNTERAYNRSNWESDRTFYNTVANNLYNREFTAHNTNETNNFNAYQQSVNEEIQRAQLKLQQDAATSGGGGDDTPTSLFGGYTEKEFTELMSAAASNADKDYGKKEAMALVIAAGYSDSAWAIYDLYFGEKKEQKPITPATTYYRNGNQTMMIN